LVATWFNFDFEAVLVLVSECFSFVFGLENVFLKALKNQWGHAAFSMNFLINTDFDNKIKIFIL